MKGLLRRFILWIIGDIFVKETVIDDRIKRKIAIIEKLLWQRYNKRIKELQSLTENNEYKKICDRLAFIERIANSCFLYENIDGEKVFFNARNCANAMVRMNTFEEDLLTIKKIVLKKKLTRQKRKSKTKKKYKKNKCGR